MKFTVALHHARHHIVFLIGLITAFAFAIQMESWKIQKQVRQSFSIEKSEDKPARPVYAKLTEEEKQWANIAWKYFENNLNPETGLVNSVDGYPASTMWDTGSYLLALISAQRLQVIDQNTFDSRMQKALSALAKIPLFDNQLPNKSYNVNLLTMADYTNNPTERGIGWSAIDIGRLMVPFNILIWNYPQHFAAVNKVVSRWHFAPMIKEGVMYGTEVDANGKTNYVQEGRIGYEEYAAKSMALAGQDVASALNYQDFLRYVKVYNVKIPTDSRRPEEYHAHNYVVSESYILDGLEFGWDHISEEFAYRVYQAQFKRYEDLGVLTAVSEDNIDRPPYFVYNTVFSDGKIWNTITDTGEDASQFRSLSTKAAFGWDSLYRSEYSSKLVTEAKQLFDPEKGFYSGLYEETNEPNKALTANTNAIILESLYFRQFGPLMKIGGNRHAVADQGEQVNIEIEEGSATSAQTPQAELENTNGMSVEPNIDEPVKELNQLIPEMPEPLTENVNEAVSETVEQIQETIKGIESESKQSINNEIQDLNEGINQNIESLKPAMEEANEDLENQTMVHPLTPVDVLKGEVQELITEPVEISPVSKEPTQEDQNQPVVKPEQPQNVSKGGWLDNLITSFNSLKNNMSK